MRIVKHKHWNSKTKILSGLTLLLVFALVYYFYVILPSSREADLANAENIVNSVDYGPATEEQKDAGYAAKKQALDPSPTPKSNGSNTQGPTIDITSVNQDNGVLSIRTTIDSTNANGVCNLLMTKDGSSPITQQVELDDYGSYSVCKGFDIPKTSLSSGNWHITVSYSYESQKSSVSKDVTI